MKIRFLYILCAAAVLSSCGGSSPGNRTKSAVADTYPVMTVVRQDASLERVFPATLRGEQDVEIKPRIDGFIEAVLINEGAHVRAGQQLFRIDSPSSAESLTRAEAAVVTAEALVSSAEIDVKRFRPLAEKEIISRVQLQTYENAYRSAQASLDQARASLQSAKAQRAWASVTSPVDGVVGKINFREGSLVGNTNVLTTVSNVDKIYAYFSVSEPDLMDILSNAPGKTEQEKIGRMPDVSLILMGNSIYDHAGRIETISGMVDTKTGSINVRATFPNRERLLKSGASGKVVIPNRIENVFVIPQKATFPQQDKILIYKVQGDSVVQTLISTIPLPDGVHFAVMGGLEDGDVIVTDGIATLSQGKKIKQKAE